MRTQILAGTLSVCSTICVAQTYDVVILNGRVMDPETGFDQLANVGISNGWITAITDEEISGNETIDATGHVVAPGFIDLEQHGLDPWGIKVNLRDGVTTQMDFEVGAANIDEWYEARKGVTQANYGTVVGQEFARMRVHDGLVLEGGDIDFRNFFALRAKSVEDGIEGWSSVPSNREQMNEITAQLDEGLRLGALGVGSTIGYAREGITTYEMFEAQRAAARYGRLTSVHHRFHPSASTPTETQTGVNEILVNAMVLGAPLHIHHDNDYGWWENQEKLQMARDQGYNVWSSYYPWTAGSGNYGASIIAPENWEGSMGYKYEDTIFDPQLDRFVTKDEFLSFAENEPGRTAIVFSPPREQWLNDWITIAGYGISGDGMAGLDIEGNLMSWDAPYEDYAGHPRSAGSHALVLRLAREADVPLMLTLTQLSYIHAKRLGDTGLRAMQVRGRMQEGMVADITIFDPETVTERANYTLGQQGLPSEGIPYVLVNGTIVVENSEVHRDVYAGQQIRFPVEENGRFVPAGREQIMGILTPDTGTVRPTLLDDIKNDEASVAPVTEPTNQFAAAKPADPFDWFAPRNGLDDGALFFCVVHARFEDRATAKRDYAKAMMSRTGGSNSIPSEQRRAN